MARRHGILIMLVTIVALAGYSQTSLVEEGTLRIPRTPSEDRVEPSPEASAMLRHEAVAVTSDSDGRKLRVSHYGAGGDLLSRTDYIGDCVLRDGKLLRTLLPTGYMENDSLFFFAKLINVVFTSYFEMSLIQFKEMSINMIF